jgi:hypothetical protein
MYTATLPAAPVVTISCIRLYNIPHAFATLTALSSAAAAADAYPGPAAAAPHSKGSNNRTTTALRGFMFSAVLPSIVAARPLSVVAEATHSIACRWTSNA